MHSVEDALDHDVQTKKMQVTVEVLEQKLDGDLEAEIAEIGAVKKTHGCETLCPTCGEPYDERIRLGFNHPVLLDEVDKFCMGEKDETDGAPGGLGWLYSHGGNLTSDGI